ncbi:helix-turn-helix domain-containing protein [bacterium]|nr:helix-turn-helix domain-containing protein [bacterium]
MTRKCKFPGCTHIPYASSTINDFCGYHQSVIRLINELGIDEFKKAFRTQPTMYPSDILETRALSIIFTSSKNNNGTMEVTNIRKSISVPELSYFLNKSERNLYSWFENKNQIKIVIINGRRRITLAEALKWCIFFAESLTIKQAAQRLNVDYRYLRHLVNKKRIPAHPHPCIKAFGNPTYLILKSDLLRIRTILKTSKQRKVPILET